MNPLYLHKRWKQQRDRTALQKDSLRLDIEAQKRRVPMPSLRQKLTITSSCSTDISQGGFDLNFDHQANSSLLSKLSFDIREQIYRLILGIRCFHIMRKGNRLAFFFCQARTPISHGDDACWGWEYDDGTFHRRDFQKGDDSCPHPDPLKETDPTTLYKTDGGLLPLLLACRRMSVQMLPGLVCFL